MKKLVILADESVLAGCARSGVAEVADSLANAMTGDCEVSVVCPNGNEKFLQFSGNLRQYKDGVRTCRLFGVTYYAVSRKIWPDKAMELVDELAPDIFHNFAAPELLESLSARPGKCIYTIDQKDFVKDKATSLSAYDAVTTVSEAYTQEILGGGDELAETLAGMDFRGITNGILYPAFQPEKGLLVEKKYSAEDLSGKAACKKYLCEIYGLPEDKCIYLMMCRLVRDKGLDTVIESVHAIRDSGGFLLIVGKGDSEYEEKLCALTRDDGVLWLDKWASALQSIPMLSGADFYLSPSVTEPCGLMPMHAARFGCIPIVTLSGGLKDNFDSEIAVVVGDGGMETAITEAAELYADQDALTAKRAACMNRDFSWASGKAGYLEVYDC
ncbi:MAG: glycosyltransferase [Lachnospiraceae bacterium]|nr:glycosyltransferase [Lachnospiraceae bacterium]